MLGAVIIKWATGEMELALPYFIECMPDTKKCKKIADLAKISDRDYGTKVVPEIQAYCSEFLQTFGHKLNSKRETTAWKDKIVKFMTYLAEPLPKVKAPVVMPKSKKLF